MQIISTQARVTSLFLAVVATFAVLGSTLAGMQAGAEAQHTVLAMEKKVADALRCPADSDLRSAPHGPARADRQG